MRAQGVPTRSLVALLCGLGAINAAAVKMASKAPFTKAWVLGLGVAVGELHLNLQESRHEDWAVVLCCVFKERLQV